MNIGIVGYGKMGRAIEKLAQNEGISILWIKDKSTPWDSVKDFFDKTDVAVEFTEPGEAFQNCAYLIKSGIPVVCGTTGWMDRLPDLHQIVIENEGSFLYGSNFSIGVQLFFRVNQILAESIGLLENPRVKFYESHHIHKKDKPSGTALHALHAWVGPDKHFAEWQFQHEAQDGQLAVEVVREGEVFGIHQVEISTVHDKLIWRHEAKDRHGFAAGVLLAARWLLGRRGVFEMRDYIDDMIRQKK